MLTTLTVCWMICSVLQLDNTDAFECLNRQIIPDELRCSGTYECWDGSDEINCPINQFNNQCDDFFRPSSFTDDQRCDGVANCVSCLDELSCSGPINLKYFRCDDWPQTCWPKTWLCDGYYSCADGSDEIGTGFGFKCNGIRSNQFGYRIPNASAVSHRCIVPQQFLLPPPANTNETLSICFNNEDDCYMLNENGKPILNISKCWPCLDGTIIQRQQVCDTVFDCADLSDECLCERHFTSEICDPLLLDNNCSENQVRCEIGTKCIDVHLICDGGDDCPNGTDEMRCRTTPRCPNTRIRCENVKGNWVYGRTCDGRFECLSGQDDCGAGCSYKSPYCDWFNNNCSASTSQVCDADCSLLHSLQFCDKVIDCEDGMDERFCPHLKHCDEEDPSSPIYNSLCTGDRCNLVADCDNMADEMDCSSLTHFYCDNNKKFIPTKKLFDGVFDCEDFTDECLVTSSSVSSQTELIGNKLYDIALWIIMLLAVVGNLIVIIKTSIDVVHANQNANASSSTSGLCFSIMLLNLAVADFLMGFYLLFIASKSVEFSGTYCQQRRNWLLSSQCVFSGALAVVSSQMSVFMLVVMASYRLYVVLKPFEAKHMSWRRLSSIIACFWALSILLAVIPTLPSINNNLATEIIIDQPYIPQSVSIGQLIDLTETVSILPDKRQTIPVVTVLSISSFCKIFNNSLVVPYYCEQFNEISTGSFGYYSTDGVCLPRYFGSSNEQAFIYSFVIVLLDFAAFLYMLSAYVILYYSAKYNRKRGNCGNRTTLSEAQSKRSQALSGTITRIIITDFLCWIPICIMSFLSFAGVEIPGMAYPITAIFLIPINSAVNPWIYSSFLVRETKKIWPWIRHKMKKRQTPQEKRIFSLDVNTRSRNKVTEF